VHCLEYIFQERTIGKYPGRSNAGDQPVSGPNDRNKDGKKKYGDGMCYFSYILVMANNIISQSRISYFNRASTGIGKGT